MISSHHQRQRLPDSIAGKQVDMAPLDMFE